MKLILTELRNNIDVAWTLSRAKNLEEGQSFTFGTLIGKIEIGKVKTKNGLGKTFYIKQLNKEPLPELEYMRKAYQQTSIDNLSQTDIRGIERELKYARELESRIRDAKK